MSQNERRRHEHFHLPRCSPPSSSWQYRALAFVCLLGLLVGITNAHVGAGPDPMPQSRSAIAPVVTPAPGTVVTMAPPPRPPIPPVATASATPARAPNSRLSEVVGAYVPAGAQDPSILDTFEILTGHRMRIIPWYQPWGYVNGWYQPVLDSVALENVAARHATPLITWEAWGPIGGVDPSHLANIPTGAFDSYIDSWAQGLKTFGKPVYLRLFHEMNYQGYPWAIGVNGNTSDDLVAAWRYIHDWFTRVGATNVWWVWCPNPENAVVTYRAMYPGDGYVDWFGLDVFNGGTQFNWGGWRSAEQIAARSYQLLQAISPAKPLMLAEVSSVEQGGSKAQWITDLYTSLPRLLPNVRAIIWFDEKKIEENVQTDWRVNSSTTSLQAYITALTVLP